MKIQLENSNIELLLEDVSENDVDNLKITLVGKNSYILISQEGNKTLVLPSSFLQSCVITIIKD